nr:ATP-binding protein [Loktanella sp. 5RATIMAR09]
MSNMTHWFRSMGSSVDFLGLDLENEAIKYLDDSLFFELHNQEKLSPDSACRDTTIPVRQLARRDSHGWLEYTFLPWLMEKTGLTKNSLAEVKSCLQEIINNISDHTDFEEGCIFGQWYPKTKKILITVADFGVGIPTNVRKVSPSLTDTESIIKAAEDGFSSKSLPTNRGAGLYLLLLNIVQRFEGSVTIRSGLGYATFVNQEGSIYVTEDIDCGYCVGTTIDIALQTDKIPYEEDDQEEDLEW